MSTRVIPDEAALFTDSGSWVVLLSGSQPAAQSLEAVAEAIRACESTLRSLQRDSINLRFVWNSVQVESICIQLPQAVFVASCFGIPSEGYSYTQI